jgi:ABC-type Mn2+/Zn2+ transport system ATPase subunit
MTSSDDTLLTMENVAVGYGRQPVLPDVNLRLRRGSFTGLLGANGSGKSTLIKTILGIIPPLAGRLSFNVARAGPVALGYVPQRDALDPIFLLSSFEVVLMGVCGRVGPGRFIGRAEKDWAEHCLKQTGSESLRNRRFSQLSGGQKQRVLIARALAARPDFLFLDEPTSGIDVAARQAIMELLRDIHRQQQLTLVMASHDLPVVRRYVERVIWLHDGKTLEGPAGELLARDRIEAILDLELN